MKMIVTIAGGLGIGIGIGIVLNYEIGRASCRERV